MLHEVVFMDFNGVIADTYQICFDVLRQSQPHLTPDHLRQQLDKNIVEQLTATQDQLHLDFENIYHDQLSKQSLVEDIADAIERLNAGHPLFIVASSPAPDIRKYLAQNKLDHFFQDIIGTETSPNKVDIFQSIIKQHRIPPKESVCITDTLSEIYDAHRVNIQPIAATWGFHDEDKLRRGNPVAIVESPEQLSGAVEEAFDFSEEYD